MHVMFRRRQQERKQDVFFCQKSPRCLPGKAQLTMQSIVVVVVASALVIIIVA
jgi:hypothetical protein